MMKTWFPRSLFAYSILSRLHNGTMLSLCPVTYLRLLAFLSKPLSTPYPNVSSTYFIYMVSTLSLNISPLRFYTPCSDECSSLWPWRNETITLNRLNSLCLNPHRQFLSLLRRKQCRLHPPSYLNSPPLPPQLVLLLPLLLSLSLNMEESMKKSSLSIGPFFSLSQMECESYLPQPELFMSPSVIDPRLPSLNVFGVVISATIERIVHSTSVPTVINQLPDTPFPLVSLPNATFAVDGDILLNSAPFECAQFVINMDMWWMTVLLRHFSLNRQPTFTQVPLPLNPVLSRGVLIEPGAQWYEGGNVTNFLLFSNIFLLMFSHHTYVFLGMCRYNYVSCLLVVHPLHSCLFVL